MQPDREGEVISRAAPKLPAWPGRPGADACAISHSIPIDDPEQVHQITPTLFSQYEVDGGSISLGGCLMEDVPFLRLESQLITDASGSASKSLDGDRGAADNRDASENSTVTGEPVASEVNVASQGSDAPGTELIPGRPDAATTDPMTQRLMTIYVFDKQGQQVTPEIAHALGLDYPEATSAPPTNVNPHEIRRWLTPLLDRLQMQFEKARQQVVRCEIVWCKRASGKIVIQLGEHSASIPFSGWARQLASGKTPMPPFECPFTGRQSHRITRTESGELTVPEALKTCAVSGRRVLETELELCEATERLCLPEYLGTSEVSGRRVIKDKMVSCKRCGQLASPDEIKQGRCVTCEHIGARPIESQRVKNLLEGFPGLRAWKGWQFSESTTCELYQGYGWLKTIFVCIDKSSRKPRRVLIGGRLAKELDAVPESEWPEVLEANKRE